MESPPPPLIPKFKNKTLNHANLDQIWYLTQEWKKIVKLLIRFSTKKQLHRINFAFSTFIRHTISGLTNIQLHIFQRKKLLGFESIIHLHSRKVKCWSISILCYKMALWREIFHHLIILIICKCYKGQNLESKRTLG